MTAMGIASAVIVALGSIWLIRSAVERPFLERLRAETAAITLAATLNQGRTHG